MFNVDCFKVFEFIPLLVHVLVVVSTKIYLRSLGCLYQRELFECFNLGASTKTNNPFGLCHYLFKELIKSMIGEASQYYWSRRKPWIFLLIHIPQPLKHEIDNLLSNKSLACSWWTLYQRDSIFKGVSKCIPLFLVESMEIDEVSNCPSHICVVPVVWNNPLTSGVTINNQVLEGELWPIGKILVTPAGVLDAKQHMRVGFKVSLTLDHCNVLSLQVIEYVLRV